MPRPGKAIRRQKINAGLEYKKGNRKEAHEMWDKAAAGRKERLASKRHKNKPAADAAGGEGGSPTS